MMKIYGDMTRTDNAVQKLFNETFRVRAIIRFDFSESMKDFPRPCRSVTATSEVKEQDVFQLLKIVLDLFIIFCFQRNLRLNLTGPVL